ncbi:hypothetical protein DPSP01_011928 [Paraphaeosphaeria sporulosa]
MASAADLSLRLSSPMTSTALQSFLSTFHTKLPRELRGMVCSDLFDEKTVHSMKRIPMPSLDLLAGTYKPRKLKDVRIMNHLFAPPCVAREIVE